MREIVKDILDAPMPVVVYVSPNGARAASAGAFITEAADVAAMAPQTQHRLGQRDPSTGEDIDDTLGEKIENDAAAFIRALAESTAATATLAERDGHRRRERDRRRRRSTPTRSTSSPIDQDDLLAQLDGFEVQGPKAQTLDTAGLEIDERDMPFSYELLQILVNPTIAFLLLLVGLVGIAIEIFSPGLIIPGALGAVSLLLGAYGSAAAAGDRDRRSRCWSSGSG